MHSHWLFSRVPPRLIRSTHHSDRDFPPMFDVITSPKSPERCNHAADPFFVSVSPVLSALRPRVSSCSAPFLSVVSYRRAFAVHTVASHSTPRLPFVPFSFFISTRALTLFPNCVFLLQPATAVVFPHIFPPQVAPILFSPMSHDLPCRRFGRPLTPFLYPVSFPFLYRPG